VNTVEARTAPPSRPKTERLKRLQDAGVSIWLDTLSRELLETGEFAHLVREFSVTGATSNPTIFAKAITSSDRYDGQLRSLSARGIRDPQALFFALALEDVRRAADVLRPVYDATGGADGFISFECTPDLADDSAGTIQQALQLRSWVDRPNVMIKVPATAAGPAAIEELTARGVNVNVTLLFSVERYEQAIEAYLRGLEHRLDAGLAIEDIASVASFFVSRVDAKAASGLASDSPLRGRVAIANAQLAYARYRERFSGARWERLERGGARPQRPLWASTGTKDPALSDVLYVESLIAPGVVNTMPAKTLEAFADHGEATSTLGGDAAEARRVIEKARAEGIDLEAITAALERDGVDAFCDSYRELLGFVESRLRAVRPQPAR
jgi:transaldolase